MVFTRQTGLDFGSRDHGSGSSIRKGIGYVFSGDACLMCAFRSGRRLGFRQSYGHSSWSSRIESGYRSPASPLSCWHQSRLVLSADPKFGESLLGLEPVGGGMMTKKRRDDWRYLCGCLSIWPRSGRFTAVDVLAQGLNSMRRIGLDPRALLRQDRLMSDQLGFPGDVLREY